MVWSRQLMGYQMTAIPQKLYSKLEWKEDVCIVPVKLLFLSFMGSICSHACASTDSYAIWPAWVSCATFILGMCFVQNTKSLHSTSGNRYEEFGLIWGTKFGYQTGKLIKQGLFWGKATYLYSCHSLGFVGELLHLDNDWKCLLGFPGTYINHHSRKKHLFLLVQWEKGKVDNGMEMFGREKLHLIWLNYRCPHKLRCLDKK